MLLVAMWAGTAAAQEAPLANAVKATFLYKFAEFVAWPVAPVAEGTPFVLCAVGDDGVTASMDRSTAGQRVGSRQVLVRHLQRISPADQCDAAYLAGSPEQSANEAAQALHGVPILTIADTETNPRAPAIIKFVISENRVRFDIDDAEAAQDRLMISSKLLGLARSVRKRP